MKLVYTFTMKDNKTDDKYDDKLRLLACMLYESIYNYYGDGKFPLDINDSIIYNQINDIKGREYRFDSELSDDIENVYYEPFLIGNNSFGITIYDESFNIEIIKQLLNENLLLLNIEMPVQIRVFSYLACDIYDESNREDAIETLMQKFGVKQRKVNWFEKLIRHNRHNENGVHRR